MFKPSLFNILNYHFLLNIFLNLLMKWSHVTYKRAMQINDEIKNFHPVMVKNFLKEYVNCILSEAWHSGNSLDIFLNRTAE